MRSINTVRELIETCKGDGLCEKAQELKTVCDNVRNKTGICLDNAQVCKLDTGVAGQYRIGTKEGQGIKLDSNLVCEDISMFTNVAMHEAIHAMVDKEIADTTGVRTHKIDDEEGGVTVLANVISEQLTGKRVRNTAYPKDVQRVTRMGIMDLTLLTALNQVAKKVGANTKFKQAA